jgi:hypothetical protein
VLHEVRNNRRFLAIVLVCLLIILVSKYFPYPMDPASASTSGGISITSFGAQSVGTSHGFNSTAAFQKALNRAIKNQVPLIIPNGTFEVDSGVLHAIVPAGKSLDIVGSGEKSVLRRRSGSVYKDSQDILSITSAKGHVKQIILRDFSVDGNAAGNPLPAGNHDPYLWQHSSSIRINGASSSAKIRNVIIENLTCYDPVADHIYFPGYNDSFVDTVQINKFYAYNRSRTRSDVTITGGLRRLDVTDSTLTRLETELNRPSNHLFVMKVSNVKVTQKLDISGDNMEFYGEHLEAAHVGFWKVKGSIQNSKLHFQKDVMPPRADKVYSFRFINTEFYYPVASDGTVYPFTLDSTFNVAFEHCKFIIDSGANVNPVFPGRALETKARTNPTETRVLKVKDCEFDKRFSEDILLDRSGTAILTNNVYSGADAAITMSGTLKYPLNVVVDGGTFANVRGLPFQFREVDGLSFTTKNLVMPAG